MSTFRIQKNRENPYVMLDKFSVNDSGLSWKAKGLLAYLLSKPDDWVVKEHDLVAHAKDGRASMRAGLEELIQAGYLVKYGRRRDDKGRLYENEYQVFERPLVDSLLKEAVRFPYVRKSNMDKTRAKPRKKPRYPKIRREITSRADDGCATDEHVAVNDIEFLEAVRADSRRRREREA